MLARNAPRSLPHCSQGKLARKSLIDVRILCRAVDNAVPMPSGETSTLMPLPPAALSASVIAFSTACLSIWGLTNGVVSPPSNNTVRKFPSLETASLNKSHACRAMPSQSIFEMAVRRFAAAAVSSKVLRNSVPNSSAPFAPSLIAVVIASQSISLNSALAVSPNLTPAAPHLNFVTKPRRMLNAAFTLFVRNLPSC